MYNWKGKTILIVEDEEINYIFLQTLVEKNGASVLHAWNGQQAIDIVKDQEVSLILMDIKMPIMDGIDATLEIRKTHPDLPIVAQTAYTMGNDRNRCMEAGCSDFITKPIRRQQLYEVIAKHFN